MLAKPHPQMSLLPIAKRAIGKCYHAPIHSVLDVKLCIAMKNLVPSVNDLVYKNIDRNPSPFTLDRTNSPYLYMVYNHRISIQPENNYIIDDTNLTGCSKMHHCECNNDVNNYHHRVPLETDSAVALYLLHNKALQKLANQLPAIKRINTTRTHHIDLLLVDLCLVSKMITRELKLHFDILSEHVRTLKYTTSPWVTKFQDCAIRIILEYLRNIHIDDDCPISAKYSILSAISGLEFILQEHFANRIHNFHYIDGLV